MIATMAGEACAGFRSWISGGTANPSKEETDALKAAIESYCDYTNIAVSPGWVLIGALGFYMVPALMSGPGQEKLAALLGGKKEKAETAE